MIYSFAGEASEPILGIIKGRGIARFNRSPDACLCQRPYTHILCENCGHLMFGRVRYRCPKHTKVKIYYNLSHGYKISNHFNDFFSRSHS